MSSSPDATIVIHVTGMTCSSCELLLERALKNVPGVTGVTAQQRKGRVKIHGDPARPPSPEALKKAIVNAGYGIRDSDRSLGTPEASTNSTKPTLMEIGAALLMILALYKLLQTFDLVSLAPSTAGSLTFGGIFLIGLVAGSSSCLAVTGGLLLAMAAKYNQTHGGESPAQRLKPLIQFNVGRIISYFLLGGAIGAIGTAFSLPIQATAYLNIIVALVMFCLALTILGVIPKGSLPLRPPKALAHRISNLTKHEHPLAPLALGALTFFLPCGFTQSLQLAALASGGFVPGALIMGIFALGTLPALLGISLISSAARGSWSRMFLTFSGTLVLLLAIFNLRSGLALAGFDVSFASGQRSTISGQQQTTDATTIQEVRMAVTSEGYEPDSFTVRSGVPVKFHIDGIQAGGCTRGFVIPSLGIQKILDPGDNVIAFTPTEPGRIPFSCSMGMVRGSFTVL